MFTWEIQYASVSGLAYYTPLDVSFHPNHFAISTWLDNLS